jgi:hypothetical protein
MLMDLITQLDLLTLMECGLGRGLWNSIKNKWSNKPISKLLQSVGRGSYGSFGVDVTPKTRGELLAGSAGMASLAYYGGPGGGMNSMVRKSTPNVPA